MKGENNYTDLTAEKFEETINAQGKALVEFKAQWSGICHMVNPIIRGIAKIYQGSLSIYGFDTDTNVEIANKYGVKKLPTIIFFEKGKPVDTIVGAHSRMEIINRIETLYN